MQNKNFTRNPEKLATVHGARQEAWSHLHSQFIAIRQILWKFLLELHVHTTQIRNKWDCWKSSAWNNGRHLCCVDAFRSEWKFVNITLSLQRTSQEFINLERHYYWVCLRYVLVRCVEFGCVRHWLQTWTRWKRWTHQKSILKNSQQRMKNPQSKNIFPLTCGRMKIFGGDQDLKTSTNSKRRSAVKQRYRHDDKSESKFIRREEACLIPLKHSDVSRTTHTYLDVKQKNRIDDYWNIDLSGDLSDPWNRFHTILYQKKNLLKDKNVVGERLTRQQFTSRPDHLWPELQKTMGKQTKLKEKWKWLNENPQFDNAGNCGGSILLTRRMTNSKKNQECCREIGNICGSLWFGKLWKRIVAMVHPTKLRQDLRVFWKLMNL